MKIFSSFKDSVKGIQRQATDRENAFAKHIPDKGLVSRLYKELSKCNTKKTHIPIKHEQKI